MDDDAVQGMLFAGIGQDTVEDSVAATQLRLCTLNVGSPSPSRAQRLVDWLLTCGSNALILTEMQPKDGGQLIRTSLHTEGFQVMCTPGWSGSRFLTVVATKGFEVTAVQPIPFDPRIVAVDLASTGGKLRLIGVYAPTNGMSPESSQRRREFQQRLLTYLASMNLPDLCVTGDLNVVEPDHRPPLPAFEDHDYAFYTGLKDLSLQDAYRVCQPDGGDHSWFSPRFGNQRLDHVFIGQHVGVLSECAYDHSTRRQQLTDHAALKAVVRLPA